MNVRCLLLAACGLAVTGVVAADDSRPGPTMSEVLAASKASDWRPLDPASTLYLQMATGRVVIELAPAFVPEQHVPISSVRLAADVPMAERARLEVIRTDTPTFTALVESRRNRRDDWYKVPAGHVELCNVPIVARPMP